jgi:hypothetical protein
MRKNRLLILISQLLKTSKKRMRFIHCRMIRTRFGQSCRKNGKSARLILTTIAEKAWSGAVQIFATYAELAGVGCASNLSSDHQRQREFSCGALFLFPKIQKQGTHVPCSPKLFCIQPHLSANGFDWWPGRRRRVATVHILQFRNHFPPQAMEDTCLRFMPFRNPPTCFFLVHVDPFGVRLQETVHVVRRLRMRRHKHPGSRKPMGRYKIFFGGSPTWHGRPDFSC